MHHSNVNFQFVKYLIVKHVRRMMFLNVHYAIKGYI